MKLCLSELENVLESSLVNNDVYFDGVSIDSRTTKKNELFIAIKGINYDGHIFIQDAIKNGACGLITEEDHDDIPYIKVPNTLKALGKIASYYSRIINPKVIKPYLRIFVCFKIYITVS